MPTTGSPQFWVQAGSRQAPPTHCSMLQQAGSRQAPPTHCSMLQQAKHAAPLKKSQALESNTGAVLVPACPGNPPQPSPSRQTRSPAFLTAFHSPITATLPKHKRAASQHMHHPHHSHAINKYTHAHAHAHAHVHTCTHTDLWRRRGLGWGGRWCPSPRCRCHCRSHDPAQQRKAKPASEPSSTAVAEALVDRHATLNKCCFRSGTSRSLRMSE